MQYFLVGQQTSVDSLLDSTTLESESSLFLFLLDLFLGFLAAAEDYFFSSLGSKFSTLVSNKSLISLMVESA